MPESSIFIGLDNILQTSLYLPFKQRIIETYSLQCNEDPNSECEFTDPASKRTKAMIVLGATVFCIICTSCFFDWLVNQDNQFLEVEDDDNYEAMYAYDGGQNKQNTEESTADDDSFQRLD